MIKKISCDNGQSISFSETRKGKLESSDILIPIFNTRSQVIIDTDGMENLDEIAIKESIDNLLKLDAEYKTKIEPYIFEKYKDARNIYHDEEDEIMSSGDIWEKIALRFIYIKKRRRDGEVYMKLQFDCVWDEEGGLQLVFNKRGSLVRVSSIDGWLTDADAYGKPDSWDKQLNRII